MKKYERKTKSEFAYFFFSFGFICDFFQQNKKKKKKEINLLDFKSIRLFLIQPK